MQLMKISILTVFKQLRKRAILYATAYSRIYYKLITEVSLIQWALNRIVLVVSNNFREDT